MPKTRKAQEPDDQANLTTYATPALEKGLDILELLAHQSQGLTKSELARSLNRSVSEIFRMLVCLERRGYIAQVADERYSLTLRLFQLVQEHPPTERLLMEALPAMKRLVFETGQSCHLGVLDSGKVVILAQINPPTPVAFSVKLGSATDIMEATSGYVILAHQEPQERKHIMADWVRWTGKRLPSSLNAHLKRIQKDGYEKRPSYQVKGITNISFPVSDERGSALAALTIPFIEYNTSTMKMSDVITALKLAAAEISVAVGKRE